MRRWISAVCASMAIGCAAPERLALELPAEAIAPPMRTLVVALTEGEAIRAVAFDLETSDAAAIARDAPAIDAWDDTPAVYTVLAFAASADALDVVPGPVPARASMATLLPPPSLSFQADVAAEPPRWQRDPPLSPAIRGLQLESARGPLDCADLSVRPVSVGDLEVDLEEVTATAPDRALISGVRRGEPLLVELTAGRIEPRALPADAARIAWMATDGASAWAADERGVLYRFGLDGALLGRSEPDVVEGLVSTVDGRVLGWTDEGVVEISPSSTITTPIPGAGFPSGVRHMAAYGERVLVLAGDRVHRLVEGEWRSETLPVSDFWLFRLAADELGDYAVTSAAVLHRPIGADGWTLVPDVGTIERLGIVAYGAGRLAVHGVGGFVEVRPRTPPPGTWCAPPTGTFRYLDEIAVDPTGSTAVVVGELDSGRPNEGSLVFRIALPR